MPPKGQSTSLKDALALLEDPTPKDFDPEALEDAQMEDANEEESGESGSEAEEAFDGREHYVSVGKSKLRKPEAIPLDPKYNGAPVSRSKLGQYDSDAEGSDSAEDDDEEEGSEEEEAESFGGFDSGASGSGEEGNNSGSDSESSDDNMGDNNDSEEEEDEDDDDSDDSSEDEEQKKRAELKKMMAEEQKAVISSVSEAAKADIAKGNAVRQQQATFDAFLGARIKLQKALVVANSPAADIAEVDEDTDMDDSIKAAEEAVLGLFNLITDLRHDLADARNGKEDKKRKRSEFETGSDVNDMWKEMTTLDAQSATWRNQTLEKWSSKVQGITVVPVSQRLNNTVTQHSITAQIRETLTDSDRLVKRTRIPRSCAPVQASKKVEEDPEIFDDTDFYQLLLKALVDQKLVDSTTGAASSGVRWKQAMREAKKRKNVDTKASKGRKLKYQVHEKLQNFMAPNPNLSWHEEQIDELFSSLLGQRARVVDESESEEEAIPDDGLRLFGRV